ncbi:MAG: OB-fold nucleic acid binding domain-containing protein [Crocinitomicaceae bacterium]|nr:OB-fold nucleic acid binding domain-containing protein [Crocinitomicaceae bacterium]MBK8925454.1 OB-fold nucleic acid binding domain-containing protein [Crocinitomicaceae bacterium]
MKKIILAISVLVSLTACKKEYDTPPLDSIPETPLITIDSLRNWQAAAGTKVSITDEVSVVGVITMDETDGNIYKNVYMQDATGAINVRILSGGGLYQGDSVRIYLKGTIVSKYNGVLQLDSVDVDNNVLKLDSGVEFEPVVKTIDQITPALESQLVKIENVQFVAYELNNTYADEENLESVNILLEDCSGNTIIVRTSGYSSFADEQIAQGNGDITVIVSHFNYDELQLYIRAYDEINMTGTRCPGIVMNKDFDDDLISSGGWTEVKVIGTTAWETSTAGGAATPYASISNWNGSANVDTENWLISPSIDLTPYSAPTLSFDNAKNYSGPVLQVKVSTDYVSGDPSTGTWTTLSPALSGGSWAWINSGELALTSYIGTNVHFAFIYTGSSSDGSTWEIDNIKIKG